MTLCRAIHDKNNPYLTINTTIAEDDRLSWKAKGIWFYAFSRKDDWDFYFKDILKRSSDGKEALQSGLKELEKYGYLYRKARRTNGKMDGQDWYFFETPKNIKEMEKALESEDSPSDGKPGRRETRQTVNPPLISNKYIVSKKEEEESQLADTRFRLASFLFEKIKSLDPKFKEPNLEKWSEDFDKLMRIDDRSEKEIESVINWVFENDFWCKNILSAQKLRKQFNQLYISMIKKKESPQKKEADEAKSKVDMVKRNKDWAIQFLENVKIFDENNYMKVKENGVELKYQGNWQTIGYLEYGFQDQINGLYLKMSINVDKGV